MSTGILLYILKVSTVGGIISVDETSCGQFMLSRPIAAGLITGLITGNVLLGTFIGALFELLYIDVLPVGGSRFPSAGLAAVTAVSICGYLELQSVWDAGGLIPLLFLISAIAAGVGGWLVVRVRRVNALLTGKTCDAVRDGKFMKMGIVHLAGILLSFFRGFVVVFVVMLLIVEFQLFFREVTLFSGPGVMLLLIPFAALGASTALRAYVTRRRVFNVLIGSFITIIFLYLS
jgi:PTS system mannose-specific IIC component